MDSCELPLKRRKIGSGIGETSSSSSSISKNDYEVFLSFRGPDTRQGFTDCLYHALTDAGISVFRDDDELALGDKIDDILTALNNSKICIVVLSPSFAESAWCLREVERMRDMEKEIVPIFYYVTPDDVKLKTDLYANALTVNDEIKYGKEQVHQWRDALKAIPTIKGRELKNTGYIEFCKQIAKEILTKLKVKHKYEIKNFVEVPDEVEDALNFLAIGSDNGRRFVGIHGMGGIGKTTLAKIIFNQISDGFDCSCFLENIRDYSSQGPDGLHKMQERLLKSLDPSMRDSTDIVEPIKMIQMNFQRKKVVIVLDDVDQQIHLDSLVGDSSWFGKGSRIIFTTRNAELHEKETPSDAHFYALEKKEMDSKQALTLFSRHAFGVDSPPKDFESLSNEAISTMGGLPLALEVVGSFLHRKKPKVWRDMIKKLEEAPHQDVQRKLKLSYDALEDEQQEIFLDIACFFIGREKKNVVYMWEASQLYPNHGIEVLISMSLIKLNKEKCFLMHDQLRDLGRAIVKVNSKDVRAGSRLWRHTDAVHLLKTNAGKEKVEALHLEEPDSDYLGRDNFVGLEKLRFLRLNKCADFGGDFGNLIPKLRWLSLLNTSSFNVTNLYLRELVVLEIFQCRFDETWSGWGQILISEQLKVLTLSDCNELISTPDLSEVVNLERLVLKDCDKLTSIHSSIEKLVLLTHLSIIRCDSLLELPGDLTSLESLKQVLLRYNIGATPSLVDLPESIGCLVSLTRLQLDGASNLPNSIGELVELKHLSLRGSENLRVVPDSIGDLRSLISLNLSGSGITELPTTIGRLVKLESLCLACCKELQRLPDSIGNLHSLIDLDMSDTSIVELPRSCGTLASLQKLKLMGSSVTSLPDSFTSLILLEKLYIGGDPFPEEDSLEKHYPVSRESWIRELYALPIGLTKLRVTFVEKIQNLSNLINLSQLVIANPKSSGRSVVLEGFEKLIKLKELELRCPNVRSLNSMDQWGALQQLKTLTLDCSSLQFRQCQLPSNLESLYLNVEEWGQLPSNLSSLKKLRELTLGRFVIEEADWFQGLECLKDLEMKRCSLMFNEFPAVKTLTELRLSKCQIKLDDRFFKFLGAEGLETSLEVLEIKGCNITCFDIKQLNHLFFLSIYDCNDLIDFQGIGNLKSLTTLYISKCHSLRRIEHLSEMNGLASIKIFNCKEFDGIENVDRLLSASRTLYRLRIMKCKCENIRYTSSSSEYEDKDDGEDEYEDEDEDDSEDGDEDENENGGEDDGEDEQSSV